MLKLIYTFFLALLIALFVGLGISAFYPSPSLPDYPAELDAVKPGCEETLEEKTTREKFNQEQNQYQKEIKPYNRTVSMISLIAAIVILVASLTLFKKIKMIADGVLLGGVFTTAYSIIRGVISEDSRFRFIIVTIGLVIALILGYIKFIKPKSSEDGQQ